MKQLVPEICKDCKCRRRTVNYDCYCVPHRLPVTKDPVTCTDRTVDVQEQE